MPSAASETPPSAGGRAFAVHELAAAVAGEVIGDGQATITGVQSLAEAAPGDITFIAQRHFIKHWPASRAGAAVVTRALLPGIEHPSSPSRPLIAVDDAELAMATVLGMFQPPASAPALGVDASAVVHPTATLGRNVRVGCHVWIDREVVIGDEAVIHPGVRIYASARIGQATILQANVVVRERCVIGRQVIIHQNTSIGADGFNYRPARDGRGLVKIPQIGTVIVEDNVEIGANACIDRGKFGATVIGAGTKIDNLCQIGHNCRIGRCCVLAAQVGLAGSVVVEDGVMMGGQSGAADHLHLGKGARIGARTGLIGDVPAGATYLGYPGEPAQAVLRQWAAIRKLPTLLRRVSGRKSPEHEG